MGKLGAIFILVFLVIATFTTSFWTLQQVCAYDTYPLTVDSYSGITNPDFSLTEDGLVAVSSGGWIIWDLGSVKTDVSSFEIKGYCAGSTASNTAIYVSDDNASWYQISSNTLRDYTPAFWRSITIQEDHNDIRFIKATFYLSYWIDAVRCRNYPYVYTDGNHVYAKEFIDETGIQNSYGMAIGKPDPAEAIDYVIIGLNDYITWKYDSSITSDVIYIDKASGSHTCTIYANVSSDGVAWTLAGGFPTTEEYLTYSGSFEYIRLWTNCTTGGTWEIREMYVESPIGSYPYYVTVLNATGGYATPSGVLNLPYGYNLAVTATNESEYYFYCWDIGGLRRVSNPYTHIVTKNVTITPIFKHVSGVVVETNLTFILPLFVLFVIVAGAIILIKRRST